MANDTASVVMKASSGVHEQIEGFLQTVMRGLVRQHTQDAKVGQPSKAGRPVNLPSVSLWMAVLVAILRGLKSQRAIWRLLAAGGWWSQPSYDIGDQAVYKRLEQEGWKPLAQLFQRVSLLLAQWLQPAVQVYQQQHVPLASFASEVIAVDETYLDKVSRRLPILRHFKNRDPQLLAGKLVTLFDVRLQQWRAIDYIAQVSEDGKKQARTLLASYVKRGALVLADLGYFSFHWFDDLTERGYSWISRVKEFTSVAVVHTYYEAGETFDRLVWLGVVDSKAKYAVRQVQFRQGPLLKQYFTNVCDPTVLPLPEIARLYARRWDIELAFLTLKRELGLHLIWSSKSMVVLAQVWACLIIAQVLQAIRMEVALRAQVDTFEVSLPLLIEALPQFGFQGRDGIIECVRQGRKLGIIRPATRLRIQAPEIPQEQLIPLPQATVLCRQPFYRREASPEKEGGAKEETKPQLEVHPQRDQLVQIIRQRIKQAKTAARQAKPDQTAKQKALPAKTQADQTRETKVKAPPRSMLPVKPDPSIAPPPWAFLQPLVASA